MSFCVFLGGMDKRLGWDAAEIEAGSTGAGRLDDHRVEPELASADGADIAAGTGADHQEPARDSFIGSALHEDHGGRLQQRLHALYEDRGVPAVDDAVIETRG